MVGVQNKLENGAVEIKKEFTEFEGKELLLFDSSNRLIGTISNELQLLDVLVQIRRGGFEGYYVKFDDGEPIHINKDGRMKKYLPSLYDTMLKELLDF